MRVTLGEICTVRSSLVDPTRLEFAGLPHIAPDSIEKASGRLLPYRTAGEDGVTSGKYRFQPGDVLYSKIRPNLNKVAIADFEGLCSADMYALDVDREQATPEYIAYLLRGQEFLDYATSLSNRANIPKLNRGQLLSYGVRLPSLLEQRRTTAVLDRADALRTKRRQVLTHLDALSRSNFNDLLATHRPAEVNLSNVATFYGGTSLPAGRPFDGQETGTLLMKVSDMNIAGNEERVLATTLWTDSLTAKAATVAADAIVLPKRGASIATNKKRITTRTTALDPNLMGVQPLPDLVEARYLFAWFQSFDLVTITSGSTVPQLNKQDLAPLRIPLPPIDVQRGFTAREAQIDAQRAVAQRALTSSGELFASLQSHAFQGEL